ncbi:Deoxyuridine 5'-triphosphate nucleotidohydrolase [Echinococcus granulosus]|uniref:Deoxyuridine 5'-triphosphate nucleotidohydrolase n=2 Tax=Echinococcus granulosus TaxID=6210 RepID=W6UJ43_ECHGR|nr:Deoxyuridine 5'-triphosphate nucleotidohydrolase [Echinococcus granulosus]EUB61043.1 Deoxyuridine 5'-triphosphate nucleotidohydrolase [Echinococcus granulosus]
MRQVRCALRSGDCGVSQVPFSAEAVELPSADPALISVFCVFVAVCFLFILRRFSEFISVMATAVLDQPVLRFRKVSNLAYTPTRGSELAAGYDLYSSVDCVVKVGGRTLINTDIQIALPPGCYGRIAPRSGLALKHGIDVGAGVVDQDYRGNIMVILFNFGDEDFHVKRGDRIAQLICERIFIPSLKECQTLDETKRGANGYGSTGV